jgi:hypothetical protein
MQVKNSLHKPTRGRNEFTIFYPCGHEVKVQCFMDSINKKKLRDLAL